MFELLWYHICGKIYSWLSFKPDIQKSYRDYFGISDLYDIQEEWGDVDGEKSGYIVYIDKDLDIDWVDLRDEKMTPDQIAERSSWIAKLNVVQQIPCTYLSWRECFDFKKLLATGYVLALLNRYDEIDAILKESRTFVEQRNREAARRMYLTLSGFVAFMCVVLMVLNVEVWKWEINWIVPVTMGIVGAYVSIWTRFGKDEMTGLASRWLHYLESIARLSLGGIFAFIATCALKGGILFTNYSSEVTIFLLAVIGFAVGFSEKMIPLALEKVVTNETKK